MGRSARIVLCAVAIAAPAVAACAKQSTERTILQQDDLDTALGATFDPNEIVDLGSFTDAQSIDAAQVQAFLARTPYNRSSFLATYQSNGVRAADAIARTANRYSLNPIAFLVRAEMAEGLLGEEFYPSPPSRVEYVFDCGCAGAGSCDPAMAGFDRQVDCLGRALRTSLDEITVSGATAGQWGPGVTSVTLDGQSVTPADASTAALYQYTPVVGLKKAGGTWLFWNLWQKYAPALDYFGSGPNSGTTGGWVGDACKGDASCAVPQGTCVTNYPGGLCTTACTSDCPADSSHGPSFCADFPSQGGFCLAVCNPGAPACRAGYKCIKVAKFGDKTQSESVCLPQ
jgi:hypothetical protein